MFDDVFSVHFNRETARHRADVHFAALGHFVELRSPVFRSGNDDRFEYFARLERGLAVANEEIVQRQCPLTRAGCQNHAPVQRE